ncbi:hypothetical protein CJ672_05205 [Arcobacter cryaerophilus gv. occultus]|uniref:hypothetical protein n=1 Tax=Aliarcobacter cryaerophilus TaxID=28198 RepID=UPI000D0217D5|nr:hypothetical protein [Aliarcobacter cryaerophilus]PRM92275.1 hypothetical protein CJ672_05205 [Arcobacter cryaerophilus gv. occultus]
MQIQNSTNQALNAFKQNATSKVDEGSKEQVAPKTEKSVEEIVNNSAAKVAISMNAQYILFEMNAKSIATGNSVGQAGLNASKDQQSVLDFLSGKGKIDDKNLYDIGYIGKPIMDLSPQEATDLVSENGFFGITQTSDRVSNFVFSFAGDDLEKLQKGRDGIVKGFDEANKMFGGNLPEISYKTQERTLALLDAKIESLKNPQAKVEE